MVSDENSLELSKHGVPPPIPALSSTTAILGAHTAISPKYDSAIHIPHNIPDEYM